MEPTSSEALNATLREEQRRIEGRIWFDHGLTAGGVVLRLYHRGFGDTQKLLGHTTTDDEGFYAISYERNGVANLDVRAVDTEGHEVPLSATKFNAGKHEVLNLVAPAKIQPLAPEYQRLSADLARHVGASRRLGDAREDNDHHDLTLLRRATGWDARLIALAAIAEKLSVESAIPKEAVYGLLRAGLPTDKVELARVGVAEVETALGQAQKAGIVRLDPQQMAGARTAFEKFAKGTRRSTIVHGGLSNFGDFLSRSGLSESEQRLFEDIRFAHRGSAAELWDKASAAGLSDAAIDGLRLQGQLAYLTRDNAALTHTLQQEIGSLDNLGRLVEMDLYKPSEWKGRLMGIAAGLAEGVDTLIPPAYKGDTTAQPLDDYAADLARQVRLSFPTRVIGRMIANEELSLGAAHEVAKEPVATFLSNAEKLGFELGGTPLDAFVAHNRDTVLADIPESQRALAMQSVRRLDRLYQITPSDEALQALSPLGFDSAFDVAAFSEDEFVARYGDRFSSAEEATLIVRKARQVTTVAYSVLTAAKQIDSAPALYAFSPSTRQLEDAKNELIKHYPSMANLFGSLDYCECEHCRSVLSPAAYLVDLLEFLNPSGPNWLGFLEKWRSEHDGEPYDGPKYGYKKPFDALIERRPDLPHLPLTCENTQTALPYIDIVNEVLEYVVAKNTLDAAAAQDTGPATTAELLAEPQNVIREAYDTLRDAREPLGLPFDLWLETVRQFLEFSETPLWRLLEVFCPGKELFPPSTNPESYARATIFTEYLGVSPSENAIFTAGPVAFYRFDETSGTTAADTSGSGNHATLVNGPALGAPGVVSGRTAVSLNGSNQYVALPAAPFGNLITAPLGAHPSTNDYSLSFETWFNAPLGASGVILGHTGPLGSPGGAVPQGAVPAVHLGTDGKLRSSLFWHGATTLRLTSPGTTTYNDGQWHHVAVTYGNGNETLYIDGVQAGQQTKPQVAYTTEYFYLLGTGQTKDWTGGNGGWHFFRGRLDEAAVYPYVLTAAQIADRVAAVWAPVAFYRFEETSGTTAADTSGSGNHATLVNNPALGAPGVVSGRTAVSLDGSNQYLALPAAPFGNLITGPLGVPASTNDYSLSFETWFNAPVGTSGVILGQTGPSGSPGGAAPQGAVPAVHLGTDGKLRSSLFWHGATTLRLTSPGATIYNDGQWHHVAVTYGNGNETLYIDGVQAGQQAKPQISYNTNYFYLMGTGQTKDWAGGNGGWHFFRGRFDEAVIYSRVLSAAQIADHVAAVRRAPALPNAKELAGRLGVSYQELAEIVRELFVNPGLRELGILWKLDLDVQTVVDYLNNRSKPEFAAAKQAFEERLRAHDRHFGKPPGFALAEIEKLSANGTFKSALVLRDHGTSGACSFDRVWLEFSDGIPADALAFSKLQLFVRLWKKLGWTIEEVGRALDVFVPRNSLPLTTANIGRALQTAIIYLSHLKAVEARVLAGSPSRLKLLTLWSEIATTGQMPLYAQLFLAPSVLKNDPIFDDALGKYLQFFDTVQQKYRPFRWDPTKPEDRATGNISLKSHLVAVQGALGLTADEITWILKSAGASLDTAALSLETLSLFYRFSLLGKALSLSVRELIALIQLSGLHPFCGLDPSKGLHADPLTTLEQDFPFSQTLRFVEVVEEVKTSGLTIEDLNYLLRHRFDDTGKYRPNRDATLALLKTLGEGIRVIRDEHAVPDDPATLSDEVLRQKLGLALPPDVTERFLAMMDGTVEFTATTAVLNPADKLTASTFADEARIRQVTYKDAPNKEQKLTLRGVLFPCEQSDLERQFDSVLTPGQKTVFKALLTGVQSGAREFFNKHLLKQPPGFQPASGFLEESDFPILFKALATEESLRAKRERLATTFLPFLQQRLIRQFILETMTAYTGADAVLVESLLTDGRLLADTGPLLESLIATGDRGMTATYFVSPDHSGVALTTQIRADDAATGLIVKSATLPVAPNSARLEGYFEVPATGAYRFYVGLDKRGAKVEVRFNHLPAALWWEGTAAADNAEFGDLPEQYLELKSGVPYHFSFDLKQLNGGDARTLVQGETLPKGTLAQLRLYPLTVVERAERALTLLTKALLFVQGLGLSEREIRYLLINARSFDYFSLSKLPTVASPDPEDLSPVTMLFAQFGRVAGYARLKRELAGGTDDLIGIFEANGARDLEKVYSLIAKLTRRDEETIKAAATSLVTAPALPSFNNERPLRQLWEALQVIERLGAPVSSLLDWTRIVIPSTNGARGFAIARDVRNTVKARFEPAAWQRVAQPIFDKLRRRQRDALVAHVMHRHGFDRIEQLYEYFLIDPGMEPVVQTSRVRLAISSLQTFVQRCLLNLEPRVHPSAINAQHWQWMKRYRVWEANRKLFLFPENWLEPEFRDDKSHLFRELTGALLKGEVSNDLAEDAFFNYLKQLGTLARLEMVTVYREEKPLGGYILHVIGRTVHLPKKYFYRRYSNQMWTPWEPVGVEMESDHVVAVIWRQRLHLFWLTFLMKPKTNTADSVTVPVSSSSVQISTVAPREVEIQLNWSEYFQGEWTTREGGVIGDPLRRDVGAQFNAGNVFVHVVKDFENGEERAVRIVLDGPIGGAFRVTSKNSPPAPVDQGAPFVWRLAYPEAGGSNDFDRATTLPRTGPLQVSFVSQIKSVTTTVIGQGTTKVITPFQATREILGVGGGYSLLPCGNPESLTAEEYSAFLGLLHPPEKNVLSRATAEPKFLTRQFFFQDSRHTFFVEPTLTETRTSQRETSGGGGGPGPGPAPGPEPGPGGPHPALAASIQPPEEPLALFAVQPSEDWVTAPDATIPYGESVIGGHGQIRPT